MKVSDIGNALTAEKGFVILYTYPTKSDEYYMPCAVTNQKVLEGTGWAAVFGISDTKKPIGNTEVTRSQINPNYCMFGNNILSFEETRGKKIQP